MSDIFVITFKSDKIDEQLTEKFFSRLKEAKFVIKDSLAHSIDMIRKTTNSEESIEMAKKMHQDDKGSYVVIVEGTLPDVDLDENNVTFECSIDILDNEISFTCDDFQFSQGIHPYLRLVFGVFLDVFKDIDNTMDLRCGAGVLLTGTLSREFIDEVFKALEGKK